MISPRFNEDGTLDFKSLASGDAPTETWTDQQAYANYLRSIEEGRVLQYFGATGIDMSDEPYGFADFEDQDI